MVGEKPSEFDWLPHHKFLGFAIMLPLLSGDSLTGALEMVCYVFTVVGAIVSYVLTARC